MIQKLVIRLIKFFNNKYWLLLTLVGLASYGQMLWMQPWEDDSGLFIKLTDLSKNVGYFGYGPLGSGVYRYTAVPFIPIYNIFGHNVVAYFALLLVLYILSVLVVYKVFTYILGETGGMVSSFILASGYIASDAFWRMTNGAATSISFILISFFVLNYWKFYKLRNLKYYFWSLLFFLISTQYFVVRDHYLFLVAITFELIFFAFKNPFKSILNSIFRLIPFLIIFYYLVLAVGDTRSSGLGQLIIDILKGNLHLTFGFLASLTNVMVPDYLTKYLFAYKFGFWFIAFAITLLIYYLLRNRKIVLLIHITLSIVWIWVSSLIFAPSVISVSKNEVHLAALGGLLILLASAALYSFKTYKGLFILFFVWILINIAAYSVYFPTVAYESISRYMSHSFYALAVLMGVVSQESFLNKKNRYFIVGMIFLYGFLNLYNSFKYQHNFLITKSLPTKKFYQDLKMQLPKIEKGDVLYFDVSSNSEIAFRAAISGAMIPNSGTISWRYGIDRYDFNLANDFSELSTIVSENKINPSKIHSFLYSNGQLIDTSKNIQNYFSGFVWAPTISTVTGLSVAQVVPKNSLLNWIQPDLDLYLNRAIESATPKNIEITIVAKPLSESILDKPLYRGSNPPKDGTIWKDPVMQNLALEYKRYLTNFLNTARFKVNTEWQGRTFKNLYDDDPNTVWQSDRVVWQNKDDWVSVELEKPTSVNRVYWINSDYAASNPTTFKIETSLDEKKWVIVKDVFRLRPTTNQLLQEITFEPQIAKFVRIRIADTLGGDSPMIAEFRVVPTIQSDLNIKSTDEYLKQPFTYVANKESYLTTLMSFGYKGTGQLSWLSNKESSWQTTKNSEFSIKYDNIPHVYLFKLPAIGTEINSLKMSNFNIPGTVKITGIRYF